MKLSMQKEKILYFQLGKQYFYQLTAEIYEQGADKFDTGIDEIDDVEDSLVILLH